MGIKIYKPTSAGRRKSLGQRLRGADRQEPPAEKALLEPKQKTGGRNHSGKITSWWRGGGHKRMYRLIDFKRRTDDVPSHGASPSSTIPTAPATSPWSSTPTGPRATSWPRSGLKVGDWVESGEQVEPKVGNCMPLKRIPVGLDVHNIEMIAGPGRQAGPLGRGRRPGWWPAKATGRRCCCRRAKCGRFAWSAGRRSASSGNLDHQNVRIGKAGRKRHMGRRPHVRGTSMNPVAHPLGGGEGRSGGGRHPCSRVGQAGQGRQDAQAAQEFEQADPAAAPQRAVRAAGVQAEVIESRTR